MNTTYVAIIFVAFGVSSCASNPDRMALGASRQQVVAQFGTPTAAYVLPQGERLQYSRQPAGRQVYDLDFDAAGHLVSARQMLTEAQFAKVQVNTWTAADVERAFGRPAQIGQVYSFKGPIWTYRYEVVSFHKLFHVFLDAQGVVRRTQITDEVPIRFHLP